MCFVHIITMTNVRDMNMAHELGFDAKVSQLALDTIDVPLMGAPAKQGIPQFTTAKGKFIGGKGDEPADTVEAATDAGEVRYEMPATIMFHERKFEDLEQELSREFDDFSHASRQSERNNRMAEDGLCSRVSSPSLSQE